MNTGIGHPVRALSAAELAVAACESDGGGKALRREIDRRWQLLHSSKPPGHLAIIERPWYWRRRRGVTCAELAAAGDGGRWIRAERRRRARALLLGALELRAALLECWPTARSSLWLHGRVDR